MLENVSPKVIHKILAAEGYLELGMPIQALEALHAVEDAGPLEAMRLYLIGEAFLRQEKYNEAIEPLHQAARLFPVIESRKAWSSLSDCFRLGGYEELAEVASLTAEAVEEIEVTYESLYQEQIHCPAGEGTPFSSRVSGLPETSNRLDVSRIPR